MRPIARAVAGVVAMAVAHTAWTDGPSAASPKRCVLEVVVSGFPSDVGTARLALYAGREAYEDEAGRPDASARLPVVDGQVVWRVDSLAPGEYAVRVYHDANENGRLDTGRRGVPLEHYGFSNDPPRRRGPAEWDEARFSLDAGTKRIDIALVPPPRGGRS